MIKYDFGRLKFLIIIIFISLILFSYFGIYSPLKANLESSLKENFSNKVTTSEVSIENQFNRYIEGIKSLSSRTMIKNQLADYHAGEINFLELSNYTQDKYTDGAESLENLVAAFRITDGQLVASYGEQSFANIRNLINTKIDEININVIEDNSLVIVNSVILNNQAEKIGHDIGVFNLSDFISKLNQDGITYEIINSEEMNNGDINPENRIVDYRRILETNYWLKVVSSTNELYSTVNSLSIRIIGGSLILLIALIFTLYKTLNFVSENIITKLESKNEEQEILLDYIETQVWYLIDPDIYGKVNQAHADFLGLDKAEIENKKVNNILSKQEAAVCKKGNLEVFQNKNKIETEEWVNNKEGNKRLISITKTPKLNNNGQVEYVVCTGEDITDKREKEKELKSQYEYQKLLSDISSELINVNSTNIDPIINISLKKIGEFLKIDRSYIFEISSNGNSLSNTYEWVAENVKAQKDNLQSIQTKELPWLMEKLYNKEEVIIADVEALSNKAYKEKTLFKEQNIKSLVALPIYIENELFGFFGFDSVKKKKSFSDKELNMFKIFTGVITTAFSKYLDDKRIKELTYYDSLTNLYNRRFFEEEMQRLDTERQLPLSIIMADLNGLKIINDSYGHKKGDKLLKKSAEILKSAIRKEDILARQGGDEFAILLPKTNKEQTEKIISRIKSRLDRVDEGDIPISIALGTAIKEKSEQNINSVLQKADDNMYQNKLLESRSSKSNIVQGLLNTLSAKSSESKEHAMRMTKLAFHFGEDLNLSNSELNRLSLLATMHDIGKTTISEEILNKPGELSSEEWKIIKKHSEKGYKIATASEEFALIADEILAHHEQWDGSGYPNALKGEEIPYLARIISIIDAYDVMTNDRPYSKAISKEEALAEIKECGGSQFDPALAEIFVEMVK